MTNDLPQLAPGALPTQPISDAELVSLAERLDEVLKRNAKRRSTRERLQSVVTGGASDIDEPLPTVEGIILGTPTENLTWGLLGGNADIHPEAVALRWAELRQEAADELASGGRLARAVGDGKPIQRARMLAIRDGFVEELQPKGSVELALLDQAVMSYTGMLEWQERLTELAIETDGQEVMVSQLKQAIDYEEKWGTSKARRERADDLHRYEALRAREAECARMVERYQRMFMRTLRQFREMRRMLASVHIHNQGQVNIAERQINQGPRR